MVTNDNGDSVTITSRGVDAVGSSHRYVTVVDSDGVSYLVGFGDATDGGYLTSDGQWGDGSDLPGPTEYGSIQSAWYNDNTEGNYNLPLLQRLIAAGVSFASTRLVLDLDNPSVLFTPSYSCVDDILHVHNDSDLGWVNSQYSFLDDESEGPILCDGSVGSTYPTGSEWMQVFDINILIEDGGPSEYAGAWNTLILILSGHITYTIPDSI